jgi:hypothetical protein
MRRPGDRRGTGATCLVPSAARAALDDGGNITIDL